MGILQPILYRKKGKKKWLRHANPSRFQSGSKLDDRLYPTVMLPTSGNYWLWELLLYVEGFMKHDSISSLSSPKCQHMNDVQDM